MSDITVGTKVCVKGQGTAAIVHYHGRVVRITKTMIIVRTPGGHEDRFRRETWGEGSGFPSIPYSAYGGSRLSTTCQRPKGSK